MKLPFFRWFLFLIVGHIPSFDLLVLILSFTKKKDFTIKRSLLKTMKEFWKQQNNLKMLLN